MTHSNTSTGKVLEATLGDVKNYLGEHFRITDWEAVDIVLGHAAALYTPGEPLWMRFVGPSRSGRTELLRAIGAHSDSILLGTLTPSAIRGGFKKADRERLLSRLNGRRVVTYDLAAILTTRKDARSEIFGLLRLAKDGVVTSDFGSSEGHLEQRARFDWIAATTPYFEQSRVMEGLLGERFMDLWWRPADREEMAVRAVENNSDLETLRFKLCLLVRSLLDQVKKKSGRELGAVAPTFLGRAGDVAAWLRTPIAKDRQGHITSIPQPEIGTDLAQGFQRIVCGLTLVSVPDPVPHIRRLVVDAVPSVRRRLVAALCSSEMLDGELSKHLRLPETTIRYHLADLEALSVVESGSPFHRNKLTAAAKTKLEAIGLAQTFIHE